MPDDLVFESATRMAERVRRRQVSPVELVDAHLARIESLHSRLNAFALLLGDQARKQARAAEAAVMRDEPLGPLHGVPVSVKDSIEIAGLPTTCGSKLRLGLVSEHDAAVVERLRQAGAIILGKTNVPEGLVAYETDNLLFGATSNPWDLRLTAGGSSGGEAAAIASGCSAAGIGSDAGGSVRVPAHFCGITALKPTPGRISGRGHVPAVGGPFASLGMLGPLARCVEDLGTLLRIVGGYDPADPVGVRLSPHDLPPHPVWGLRVGVWEGPGCPLTADTRRVLQGAARLLQDQHVCIEDFQAPPLARAPELWWNMFGRAALPLFRAFVGDRAADLSPIGSEFLRDASAAPPLTFEEYLQTAFERDQMRAWLLARMEEMPVLLTPVGSLPAFTKGQRSWTVEGRQLTMWEIMQPCVVFNLLGNPAVVVPAGFSADGLPIGVQLVGRPFEEELLLRVAALFEEARGPWPHPAAIA